MNQTVGHAPDPRARERDRRRVAQAGHRTEDVPVVIGVVGRIEGDDVGRLGIIRRVEEQEVDPSGITRVDAEIDASSIDRRAERSTVSTRLHREWFRAWGCVRLACFNDHLHQKRNRQWSPSEAPRLGTPSITIAADQVIRRTVMAEGMLVLALQLRDDALGQDFAQFDPPLIEGVDIPDRSLRKH